MAEVELRGIVKRFGDSEVVHDLDLAIEDKEFLVLVGPSGCGKSTILRMVAGLEDATSGEIMIDGMVVNELEPMKRNIAMVFQDYALYPHLTVYKNMSFGLEMRKLDKAEVRERVEAAAGILDISDLLDRKPRQLSGGQRQRVAMGRAIVRRPSVFLFDEPLSNLDANLRTQMRTEIKKLHKKVATTVIYVTHDQVEAMTLADRIVVLRGGRVEQIGTPSEVYDRPRSVFVAGFIGTPRMNFLGCRLQSVNGASDLVLPDGVQLPVPASLAGRYNVLEGRELTLGIRAEHFHPAPPPGAGIAHVTPTVEVVEPLGSDTMVFFTLAGAEVIARMPPMPRLRSGEQLPLVLDMDEMHLFDAETGLVA